jgi:sialate O-acetylesterase
VLEWLHSFPVIDMSARGGEGKWAGLRFDDDSCSSPQYSDSTWREMRLPTLWESTELGNFDGAVWFRKRVEIPASWLNRDLVLELGPIDDVDVTFVNGQRVGSHEGEGMYRTDRVYRIPAGVVRDGTLLIAVRVIDYGGGGGMFGEEKVLGVHPDTSGERVPLAGTWRYLPVAEYRGDNFFVFGSKESRYFSHPKLPVGFSAYTPTALFNGMITPLVPFALRGVVWYQGEANTNDPGLYRQLFPLMIQDWRRAFRLPGMPFYYVQIAPYEYGPSTPSQYLREAQLLTLSVKNTGMAVTLDIGNAKNIHPANKQEVGRRLAGCALAKTYGRKVVYLGPLLKSFKKHRDSIELVFEHTGSGLVVRDGTKGNEFQIAADDRVFKDAQVVVRGKRLIVSHPEVKNPQAVRYAFTNTPGATLFNGEGLPASSFRTDDWQK